jgi:hypothetical protein
MPVEVRVGNRTVSLPMTDGRGSVDLPEGASYTLDPHSKVLRREQHIERYREYLEEMKKKKEKAA